MKIRPDMIAPVKVLNGQGSANSGKGFADLLAQKVSEVDQSMRVADQESAELLAGTGSIHETMIALEEAGIKLRMAGAGRDKVVGAYQDLTRMQI